MRKELVHGKSAGKPSENRINIEFRFNPKLTESSYEFPLQTARTLELQAIELSSEVYQVIDISKTCESLFGPLFSGSQQEQDRARSAAEELIANCNAVRDFYGQLESPDPALPYPPTEIVDSSWAVLRWLQSKMLFALDIHVRYRGNVQEMLTPRVLEKLEHDLHDMQHLTLAVLEGAFATNEKKLKRWWRLLVPNGDLLSTTERVALPSLLGSQSPEAPVGPSS